MSDDNESDLPVDEESPTPEPETEEVVDRPTLKVVALWVSDVSRRRLAERVSCEISTNLESLSEDVDVVVVSTRLPVVRMMPVMEQIGAAQPKSILALCHPGGEDIALRLVSLGAEGTIAEGNEGGLASTYPEYELTESAADQHGLISSLEPLDSELLLTGFRERLERSGLSGSGLRSDGPPGLPGRAEFDRLLIDRARRGRLPRVGFVEFANVDSVLARIDDQTTQLVARRLSLLLEGACSGAGAQLFDMGDLRFRFMADDLDSEGGDELAGQIVVIGASFRPDGLESLNAAVGHAGPDIADNDRTLMEMIERATTAAMRRGGGVVNAGRLSTSEAVEVELNAAFMAVASIEDQDGHHHSKAVARLAVELAGELGYYHGDLVRVRLVALLHDIGKYSLPRELQAAREGDLSGEELETWRSHCERGGRFLRYSAGEEIAAAVRGHHEHWDGSGFPDGLVGQDIPLDARVIGVVDHAVHLLASASMEQVIEALRGEADVRFDPAVVEALAMLHAKQPDLGLDLDDDLSLDASRPLTGVSAAVS